MAKFFQDTISSKWYKLPHITKERFSPMFLSHIWVCIVLCTVYEIWVLDLTILISVLYRLPRWSPQAGCWVCWVLDHTMMGDRPPKSIKPEASFIPEKEKKIPWGTQSLPAIAVATARDQASVAVGAGAGPPLMVKSSTRCGSKSFYNLEVRLKVTFTS